MDRHAHIYIAPGLLPQWLNAGESIRARNAPAVFGVPFGYDLTVGTSQRKVAIRINQALPAHVRYVFPCRFGSSVQAVVAGGQTQLGAVPDVELPAGMLDAVISYAW